MQGGLICAFLVFSLSVFLAANGTSYAAAAQKQVYIVFTEHPPEGWDLETYYIKILSTVLGSEKAANDAIGYSFHALFGFSAELTPDQASLLKKQPEVLSVTEEKKYRLIGRDA